MDLFKAIIGKNPSEYEQAAEILVNTPDVELYKKLVKQDEYLFDFVKFNVAKRIQAVCNENNYKNLMKFLKYYSASYDELFAEVLHRFGNDDLKSEMKRLYLEGSKEEQAYAAKYLNYLSLEEIEDILPIIRNSAHSDYEPLSVNSIELLSIHKDRESKLEAVKRLESEDEFEQYEAVKFLVTYGAKDTLYQIIDVMKKSTLSENIAAEIPYLEDLENILKSDFDNAIMILCNIISAIPEIVPLYSISEYNLSEIFENLYYDNLTSSSALLLRMAIDKFEMLAGNEEYMFDCDKNTKSEISNIYKFLSSININRLNSLLYDELFEGSDFVFYAIDYVNDIEELETLLDSSNQTLLLKVLSKLKDKQALSSSHKELALSHITNPDIKQIVEVL